MLGIVPGVTVILPAYNEASAIAQVIRNVRAIVPEAEILVVDDGSTDGTGDVARGESIRVVRHEQNLGAGKSVKDGIDAATHDTIVMMDCDGEHEPKCIPDLLSALTPDTHMVVGARFGEHYRGSSLKLAARFCFRMIAQFVTGAKVPDINSGMRAFRKVEIRPYFADICDSFSFPTTLTLIYFLTKKRVTYVPVPSHKRIGTSKVRIIRDSLRTLLYMAEVIVKYKPSKLLIPLLIVAIVIVGIALYTS